MIQLVEQQAMDLLENRKEYIFSNVISSYLKYIAGTKNLLHKDFFWSDVLLVKHLSLAIYATMLVQKT